MNPNEERIREFAYQIWQSEGKPHGHAKRHWEMACKLVASEIEESAAVASPKKTVMKKQPVDSAIAKPVKKAKTTEPATVASLPKADTVKKTKAKTAEKASEKASEKLEPKKPVAAKKAKLTESQPT